MDVFQFRRRRVRQLLCLLKLINNYLRENKGNPCRDGGLDTGPYLA